VRNLIRVRSERLLLKREPFIANRTKRARARDALSLPPGARINPISKETPRLVALFPRTLERHVAVVTEREQFLPPSDGALESPQARGKPSTDGTGRRSGLTRGIYGIFRL